MSRGIVLQTKPAKGKDSSILSYEQVTDPDNFLKKRSTPAVLIIDGLAPEPSQVKTLKPKTVIPGYLGPLDDVNSHTDLRPASTLKLRSYSGKKL